MRAATLDGFGRPLRLATIERPTPGEGQLLLRLEVSGVCHTDVHVWKGTARPRRDPSPFILGHEGVGVVAAVGPGVTGWTLGERAGMAWLHSTCGTCAECRDGAEPFCQHQKAHGFDVPGTFAEYAVADSRYAARLPPGDATDLAPLMCAGLTAYGAIALAALRPGESCAIFGCGGLGLYAVQLAVRAGARVIAVDKDMAKLALASRHGASTTVLIDRDIAKCWKASERAHVCINFAPTPSTWETMVAAVLPRGRIVAAAMVAEPVPLNQEWLTASGVRILGTSVGSRAQMAELLDLHAASPLSGNVTRITLREATEALTMLDQGAAKGRFCIVF